MLHLLPAALYPRPDVELTVTDIRNMAYCPRVVYYGRLMGSLRPTTYKMQEGKLQHERVEELEERRSLRAYGLVAGERRFAVALVSPRLGLSGRVDMVIRTPSEAIPVEFKDTPHAIGLHQRYQVTAQGLLLEENGWRPVRRGFVYQIPLKKATEVNVTPDMRRRVAELAQRARVMLAEERLPGPTRQRARCRECEFRRLCQDVV
jgi:CRISPR-associated exonuclease Cas4